MKVAVSSYIKHAMNERIVNVINEIITIIEMEQQPENTSDVLQSRKSFTISQLIMICLTIYQSINSTSPYHVGEGRA